MTPAVQQFFDQISGAYRSSPVELIIVFFSLLVLVSALVVYAMVRSRQERGHHVELSRRLFEEKANEVGLSPSNRELLDRMRLYLKDTTQIHHLVTDEVAFNAAAAKLRENGEASAQSIAALRVILGFHLGRTGGTPHSSAAIPEGATVLVARNRYRRPTKAKVLAPLPQAFRIKLIDEESRLPAGAGVDIFYQSTSGVFTFHTTVLSEEGHEAMLSHSEDLKQYQKRKYYRRRIELPVRLYPFDSDAPLLSKSRDIGGGGASLINPDGHFKVGDDLEIRFRPDDIELRVTGTVVRVSDSGRTIHVNYEHIRDSLRDKIYNAIFKPPKDELDEMEKTGRQGAKTSE